MGKRSILSDLKPGMISMAGSIGAGLCCTIPLALISLGIGGGAIMAIFGPYGFILYPLGIGGFLLSGALYIRRWRNCNDEGCAMNGRWTNMAMLGTSALLLTFSTFFIWFDTGS